MLSGNYSQAVNVSPFLHHPNVFAVSAEAVVETIFPEGIVNKIRSTIDSQVLKTSQGLS